MKAFIVKAHGNFKVGDEINPTPADFEKLSDAGLAVTASEWSTRKRLEDNEAATVRAREAAIDTAIADAETRGAIPPKANKDTIRAHALVMEATQAGVGIEYIKSLTGAAPQRDLAARASQPLRSDTAPTPGLEVKASIEEECQGVIKAMEPQDKLIRAANWDDAYKLSREAGMVLKHRVMSPIIKAGGDYMLRDTVKAATFTDPNSQVGSLAGDLIIMRNLGYLVNKLAWLKYLTTDLSGEPVKFGQQILTRYITPPAVLTWIAGQGFTSDATTISNASAGTTQSGETTQTSGTITKSAPSTTDKGVILNMFKATEVEFPVSILAGTVRSLFSEQLGAQTYSLAEAINKDVLGMLLSATWSGIKTSYTKALGNWNLSGMIGLKNALTISKVPDIGRFVLLHSFYHDKLLEDSNLLSAKAIMALIHKDEAEFNTGEIPTLFGVKPLESQLAAADSTGTLQTWTDDANPGTVAIGGFAGNQSSGLFVSRPPQDFTTIATRLGIPITASVRLMTEPDSGLTVMVFSYLDNGKMSISQRVCLMWGKAQGDPRIGILLKLL